MAAIAFAPTELKATEWAGQSDTGHGMLLLPSDGATVKGIVVDTEGNPLVGASVLIKGSTNGTVTNADGRFSLNTPSRGATLVVSYMGFKTAEVQAQSEMRIELQEEVYMQGEIVVTALGIKKEERSLAYHVQQVTGENLMKVQDANFVNSLNGKIAGVQINANASGIGGSSRVVMRGTKSIDGSNNVLYVIDGIPMLNVQNGLDENAGMYSGNGQTGDATAMLNPDDIETISALTGPSAAALYGSAAANGVILITTKKGKEGVTNVTYNASMQFSSPLRLPEFQKKYGQTEPGSYYSWGDVLSTESSYDPADFFRTGTNFSQSVSLSTGNKKNLTYLSAGSVTAGGIVLLTFATGPLYVFCFALLSLSYGGCNACFGPIAADIWGTKNLGTILSLTMIGFGVGSIASTILNKVLGPSTAFIVAGVIAVIGVALVFMLPSQKKN